jgi:hypothetical protein
LVIVLHIFDSFCSFSVHIFLSLNPVLCPVPQYFFLAA